MSVVVAKTAGFCFGVRRAVEMAEQTAGTHVPIYSYGEIIHNKHEIDRLASLGVQTAHTLEEIPAGGVVIIRAHGVAKACYEALEAKGCTIVDATCPFVKKIHRIVETESAQGRRVLIVGCKDHPEVRGIEGWCASSIVVEDANELEKAITQGDLSTEFPLSMVAQTTINRKIWDICANLVKKVCTNVKIFDTICNATDERQKEARLLAGKCDRMIVIGDKLSSNTKRLYEISGSLCRHVMHIEDASELTQADKAYAGTCRIGITAGASTPARIIKEVSNMMSEEVKIETGEDFAAMLEESFKTLNTGDRVTGVILSIGDTDVQVDLGVKHTAYIPVSELSDDPSFVVADHYKVGDEIEAVVIRVNDLEGTIILSKKKIDQMKGWDIITAAKEEHTPVEGLIVEENRGGLVAMANGMRVFIPASQTGIPKDQPMAQLLKTKQTFYITEINRPRRRIVGSIRAVAQEARRAAADQIWETIEVGQEFKGTVKSLTSYGAFVDIGGVDGMVHISELSWGRVKNPAEVVSIGDEVQVYVIGLDREKKKISLGYKRAEDNPWTIFKTNYAIDDVATVKILKFMPFGAFAEIIPGVDGLIHISQIANRRIAKPEEALTIGQEVEAMIIDINDEKQKVSLSIRATLQDAEDLDEEVEDEE